MGSTPEMPPESIPWCGTFASTIGASTPEMPTEKIPWCGTLPPAAPRLRSKEQPSEELSLLELTEPEKVSSPAIYAQISHSMSLGQDSSFEQEDWSDGDQSEDGDSDGAFLNGSSSFNEYNEYNSVYFPSSLNLAASNEMVTPQTGARQRCEEMVCS